MVIQQSSALQNVFAAHIHSAYCALKCPLTAIFSLFPDRVTKLHDYTLNGGIDVKLVDIELDVATLTCLFTVNQRCTAAFLFLDKVDDMEHYITQCNNDYRYDYLLKRWIAADHSVDVRKDEEDYFLVFTE